MKNFLATLTVATLFAACSEKPSAPVAVQEPVAPQPEFVDTTTVDTSLFAAPDSAALAQDSIRLVREAFVADSTAAAEARAVPENAYPIEELYAVRTGINEFSLFRPRDRENAFYVLKNAERSLDGMSFYGEVNYKDLYGKEEQGESQGPLRAEVNMTNGTVSIGDVVFQLTDKNGKEHVIEPVVTQCVRTGDREFKVIDAKYPDTPLFTITKADPTDLTEKSFEGTQPYNGSLPLVTDEEGDRVVSYSINVKTGEAVFTYDFEDLSLKITDAPKAKLSVAPVVAKPDTATSGGPK